MIGKTKDGVYFYSVRYTDQFGNRKQKTQQDKAWTTKKEARQAMEVFLASASNVNDKLTLDGLYDVFERYQKGKIKQRSVDTYAKFYKLYISSYLGKMLISKITPLDIRRWQSWLSEKSLKNNYSSSIQQFLRSLLNFAVKYDYLEKNPFKTSFVKNNLEKKTEIVVWSTEQFKKFIDYVDDDVYRAFFMTLYLCGLRVGEAQALTVGDVSFIGSTLSVNKTYDRTNHVVTSPKTANSVRTVYMVTELRETLKRLVEAHSKLYGFSDDSILFGFDKRLSSTTIKRYQEHACQLAKVPTIRIHDFRHSHVSLLVDMGFSPFQIAERLGHTVEMVNNTYSHLFLDSQQKMAEMLEARMTGINDKEIKALN